jgi:Flp pilus assembly protein TadB
MIGNALSALKTFGVAARALDDEGLTIEIRNRGKPAVAAKRPLPSVGQGLRSNKSKKLQRSCRIDGENRGWNTGGGRPTRLGAFLVYLLGALLIIAGAVVLLSQLGVLGLLLNTLNLPAIVLFALALILVGIVLIRGASLIVYSPDHQRKDRNELDFKDLTYEDQDPWEYKKRY